MSRGTVRATGLTRETAASMIPPRPYRYRGNAGWNPAELGPIGTGNVKALARNARVAEFARLREEEGLSIGAASRRVGVGRNAGTGYELMRLGRGGS